MIFSDLDKRQRGGSLIEDNVVVNEIFDTALNIKRGQIFYARDLGHNFEQFLLRLQTPEVLLSLHDELYRIQDMDGRLDIDGSQTELFTDSEDEKVIVIQTAVNSTGLGKTAVQGVISEEGNYLTINDIVGNTTEAWETVNNEKEDDISQANKNLTTDIMLKDGKVLHIVEGKLVSIT